MANYNLEGRDHLGAVFTVELGQLVAAGYDIGLDDYPIWDENYRDVLNNKIVARYRFREIGQETPALFRHYLNTRMHEIMPYMNELYRSKLYEIEPLQNYYMRTTSENTSDGVTNETAASSAQVSGDVSAENSTTSESTGRAVVSETPATRLSGQHDYASNVSDNASQSDGSSSSVTTSNEEQTNTVTGETTAKNTNAYVAEIAGLTGITASQAMQEFRNGIIDVDIMIIESLNDLFMGVYSTTHGVW